MLDPIALARQLIDIPSPTGEEHAVGELLESELAKLGFHVRRQEVASGRFNIYAAAGGQPRVVLNSHIDTVPPWFASHEDDQFLYGRGACDTKGVIASMIGAASRLRKEGVTELALLLVVGEETDSIGAKAANRELAGLGSEFVLVGEPTESKFARASKGALTCTARFEGVAAHSAYPHLGDSAINRMVAAIADLTSADWGDDPLLGSTSVNVGVVRGGEKANIIAPWAEFDMIFRLVTSPEDIRSRTETILARHRGAIIRSHGNPPQHMAVPRGMPSSVVSFNTDVPHLGALGTPLLFGPGSILDAHGANERISKSEMLAAVETYHATVIALLRGDVGMRVMR